MPDAPLGEAFEALAHEYRRQLLADLRETNPSGELPRESLGTGSPGCIAVEMTHVHLPKLDEYGFVAWDRESETVFRGSRFEEIMPLLEAVVESDLNRTRN